MFVVLLVKFLFTKMFVVFKPLERFLGRLTSVEFKRLVRFKF